MVKAGEVFDWQRINFVLEVPGSSKLQVSSRLSCVSCVDKGLGVLILNRLFTPPFKDTHCRVYVFDVNIFIYCRFYACMIY